EPDLDAERRAGLRRRSRRHRPPYAARMRDGEILVEHAARSFRVYARENRALKDLVVARGRNRGSDVWALRDVSFGVEPGSAIGLPVRTYSSGMYMRLGFAIASHMEANVLLLDEVFAVGDEAFQRKCFGKIFEFKQRGGTIVFVSHDAASVERLCDRAVLLKDGSVMFDGPTHEAIVAYRRQLAGERDPEERAAGLKEWGGDTARVERVRLLGPDR